jgi:hypothetical protein
MPHDTFSTLKDFKFGSKTGKLCSLPELAKTFPECIESGCEAGLRDAHQ